jgi:Secretion system C-terminal sorting domain
MKIMLFLFCISLLGCTYHHAETASVYSTVQVFPNPANEQFSVRYNASCQGTIRLLAIDGQQVLTDCLPAGNCTKEFNVLALSNGLYVAEISFMQSQKKLIKLTIQH